MNGEREMIGTVCGHHTTGRQTVKPDPTMNGTHQSDTQPPRNILRTNNTPPTPERNGVRGTTPDGALVETIPHPSKNYKTKQTLTTHNKSNTKTKCKDEYPYTDTTPPDTGNLE